MTPSRRGGNLMAPRGGFGKVLMARSSRNPSQPPSSPPGMAHASAAASSSVASATPPAADAPPAASTAPPAKRIKFDTYDSATVLVGQEERLATIYLSKFQMRSDFFKAICQGEWRERADKTIRLPEVDPDVFHVYNQAILEGRINFDDIEDHVTTEATTSGIKDAAASKTFVAEGCGLMLGQLWALADFLGDTMMQNSAMNELIAQSCKFKVLASPAFMELCVEGTRIDSMLTCWMVDVIIAVVEPVKMMEFAAGIPLQLSFKMLERLAMKARVGGSPLALPSWSERCKYHKSATTKSTKQASNAMPSS